MEQYPKIKNIYRRDPETANRFLIDGDYSLPEFHYLKDCLWHFTEKVDGTNIRVGVEPNLAVLQLAGRTDRAEIPPFLRDKLNDIFIAEKLLECFDGERDFCLYGEGYGAKIQKGGGNYIFNGVSFILFDVLVGNHWLRRDDVGDIAQKLNIDSVPQLGSGTLTDAVDMVQSGFNSSWGPFPAEGIVARPVEELFNRRGHRIITKIKTGDFNHVSR